MKLLKSLSITCIAGFFMMCTSLFAEEEKPKAEEPKKTETKQMNPIVELKTNHGDITIELNQEKAPITVANFLSYVDDKFYDNTVFHRVIKNFMIQGGGMELKDGHLAEKSTKAPIKNESANGLKNSRGTIAMARTNDLDSATSQFFINVVDNKSLDHGGPYGGYAVFGKVTEGMEVVDVIRSVKTGNNGYHQDVPKTEVTILSITKK